MAKTFYTERDVEDLARAGIRQIEIDDDVVVTDVARERADRLGLRLVRRRPGPGPAVSGPEASGRPESGRATSGGTFGRAGRPAAAAGRPAGGEGVFGTDVQGAGASGPAVYGADELLIERVKTGVLTQLGFAVDPGFLDTIIRLVLAQLRSGGRG